MKTWFDIKAAAGGEKQTDILIFDEIGLWGITAKDFATALKEIPEDHAITVRINSPGGSVFDGYAIFNALKARSAQITTKIEGLAASMASVIALAGSKVTAAANSIVMIHNPWSGVSGDSDDLRKMADLLDKLTGQLVGIYAAKTGLPEADVRAAMDAETWFTGAEAKEWGLVDEVTDEIQVAASFDTSRFRNAPKSLAPAAKAEPQPQDAAQLSAITAERDELKAKLETVETQAAHSAEQIAALKVESDQRASAIDAEKAAHALTKAQLDESRAELLRRDAEIAVGSAIASGRLAETARADFVSRYVKNADDTKAILAALPVARGNAPVPPESKTEAAPDAAIYSEYRALEKGKARDDFFAKHKDAIWRAAGSQ